MQRKPVITPEKKTCFWKLYLFLWPVCTFEYISDEFQFNFESETRNYHVLRDKDGQNFSVWEKKCEGGLIELIMCAKIIYKNFINIIFFKTQI